MGLTMLAYRAFPVVLAAPSGAGKTSIARALVQSDARFGFSISVTTRAPRTGERDGADYRFVDRAAFETMRRAGELCEWAEVHGNLYGTPIANLESAADRGEHVVLDIDVQGARQIRERVRDALLIFVLPPSAEALVRRLTGRATEGESEVARRLQNARTELQVAAEFDYVVVNEELQGAVSLIRDIVAAEGHRPSRVRELGAAVERLQRAIDRIVGEGWGASRASSVEQ
jgi:guanylate kinase